MLELAMSIEKSVELEFCLYRQVYLSDFIAKCMSDRGFWGARASYVYRSLYVFLAGGGGHPKHPPLDPPVSTVSRGQSA